MCVFCKLYGCLSESMEAKRQARRAGGGLAQGRGEREAVSSELSACSAQQGCSAVRQFIDPKPQFDCELRTLAIV